MALISVKHKIEGKDHIADVKHQRSTKSAVAQHSEEDSKHILFNTPQILWQRTPIDKTIREVIEIKNLNFNRERWKLAHAISNYTFKLTGTQKTNLMHRNDNELKRKKQLTLNYIQQVKAANEERRKRQQETQWNFQVYPNLYASTQKLEITPWHSSMHNMGFAFNRTVWSNILELQDQFCPYDDYNWDYSLLHLSQNRPGRDKFKVILCKGPRVFHIGECGFHHKKANCNASSVISRVQKLLQNAKPYMFPTRVTATFSAGGAKHNKKLTKGNGGWGDIRDQELCTNMTKIGRQQRKYIYYT